MCTSDCVRCGLAAGLALSLCVEPTRAGDPWADRIVSYHLGSGGDPAYTNPNTVLGEPERFTGELGGYPGAVTPFNTAWGTDEILSLGVGGHLTVQFDEPITNDPAHPYGVDLIVFGNGAFSDARYPEGIVGGLFEEGPFSVSVSADGVQFIPLAGTWKDALFPALGYLDLPGPYAQQRGQVPSDFTRPVDPRLRLADFLGKSFAQVVALYGGSGGGIPLDIGPSGLHEVYYVRIDVLPGATSPEFDALAAVPEPATALLCVAVFAAGCARGRSCKP